MLLHWPQSRAAAASLALYHRANFSSRRRRRRATAAAPHTLSYRSWLNTSHVAVSIDCKLSYQEEKNDYSEMLTCFLMMIETSSQSPLGYDIFLAEISKVNEIFVHE